MLQISIWFVSGSATRVHFHVTVMSLDSIDEGSMVMTVLGTYFLCFHVKDAEMLKKYPDFLKKF